MFFALLIVVEALSLASADFAFCIFPRKPEQLRVALRGVNGVTVSWKTGGYFGDNDTPKPEVEYSTSATFSNDVNVAYGTTGSYHKQAFFHNVALLYLEASTRYYYRIKSTKLCVSQSSIRSFKTPPAVGSTKPLNIAFVADLGNDNLINHGGASRTMKALRDAASKTDVFVHNGDISYADDYGLGLPFEFYEQSWNTWQNNMEALTAENFYMIGPGNHEVTCFILGDFLCGHTSYRNFSAYLHRFRMPGEESGGFKNLWYSFDYGMVHIVVINTETDFALAPSGPGTLLNGGNFQGLNGQLTWFKEDLRKAHANRGQVPWIIVTGHRPFRGSLPKLPALPGNCDSCRNTFQSAMFDYKVDIYIGGHVHWYERLYPIDQDGNVVANDYDNADGLIHITNGAGGAPEGAAQPQTIIDASAKIVTGFGYVKFEPQDRSNARLSFYSSDNNQEADSITIVRNH